MERPVSAGKVLVVDDDPVTRDLLRGVLTRAGHDVREAPDGRAGLRALYERTPDLVVLDVEMPELDGWQTLERIREVSDVPVLMLTARETELEKVRGLRGGADDYVVKPFGHQELLARIAVLLRRRGGESHGAGRELYADRRVEIDHARRHVSCDGRQVTLTPLEFRLLSAFVAHPNQVLSRDQLLELVWGDEFGASPGQVKLYVGYLRHKLDPEAPLKTPIETVRGFGYMYRR
ncbi:MAG TPA: response regulator transcription factor, partial [Solirubrobacteraceae bacterium]|nr:response regulator transcription factor [Solirubrobacteraceae bacterium]